MKAAVVESFERPPRYATFREPNAGAGEVLVKVRAAALKMEDEGLISVVLLPTPRGLVVAQPRMGRM